MMLTVRVVPGASETILKDRLDDGSYKIRVHAAPEQGRANAELIRYLAKVLDVPKAAIEIRSGQTSRIKQLFIETENEEALLLTLSKLCELS